MTFRGLILFEFEHDPVLLEVNVFTATRYSGEVTESGRNELFVSCWWNFCPITCR